jgi:periplasmic protein TonB
MHSAQSMPLQSPASVASASTGAAGRRVRRVPAARIPSARQRTRSGIIVSAVVHLLILLFLLSPAAILVDPNLKEELLGAGGPGPAGGGGGGVRGTGSVHFVTIAPAPKPEPPKVAPVAVIQPPKPPEPVLPPLETPKLAQETKVEVKVETPLVGTGGGTGHDGTAGNGPGTGGGIGTGVGTGRGSAVGPGTGGGALENYPPTPLEMFIPPIPTPSSVHGFHMIADFDVDEHGTVIGQPIFTPTKDGSYNRKIRDYLKTFKFRPGTTPKGEPIRAKYQMIIDF